MQNKRPGRSNHHGPKMSYLEEPVTTNLLPSVDTQRRLIKLYFEHVHPVLPIVFREEVSEGWAALNR
jgi:hypothetical protein